MVVTINKQGLKKFIDKWSGRGKEDEDDRSFWIDLFQDVFSQSGVTDRLDFQKKVIGPDRNTKRIDVYIPETNVLIEQKSLGIALDKPQTGHDGMTPYEQAKMYDNGLPRSEKARWIVTSNFAEIWVYDMEKRKPEEDIIKISLSELSKEYPMLQFLFDPQVEQIRRELKVSQEAGDRIGKIYDALINQIPGEPTEDEYRSLNLFCVRLVFCYYAEDAGLFGKYQFRDYMKSFNTKHLRNGMKDLFRVLDTKDNERDRNDEPELLAFPYVNGGLFADKNIIIPQIDEKTHELMTETSDFNWSEISPTIFGAVFESTLNQETRRKGGMHYTSIENIHKVIDPLFLDDLKEEYLIISDMKQPNVKRQRLKEYQNKLASLKFLDPACGSGNFLTETYISLRKIENEVIKDIAELDRSINPNQIALGDFGAGESIIKVSLSQFYGIEINDFAVAVSKAALWIAESQMMKATEEIVYHNIDFLPLKSYVNIVEGNALRIDWNSIIAPNECSYIMGNPPFVGHRLRGKEQADDMKIMSAVPKYGKIDYVGAWYYKACEMMQNTKIHAAFVSTNSLCQGESVGTLWQYLIVNYHLEIQFAYQTFTWDSEAQIKAHVHCIIVGFSCYSSSNEKILFDGKKSQKVVHINPYLQSAPDVFLPSRGSKVISGFPPMTKGNEATDGGNFSLTEDEYIELISKYPSSKGLLRPYIGSSEFINNKKRYCIWLLGRSPAEYRSIPPIMSRIEKVREFRATNVTEAVHKLADYPTVFAQIRQPESSFMLLPIVSSQRRQYIPMGFMSPDIVPNPKVLIIPNATLELFGMLESSVHMAWMRVVTGRLKSDYEYYPSVYNNFPWPTLSGEQKSKIEASAQAILDARDLYPESSLADLYDPLTMPPELRKAHEANDRAVMKAYGFRQDMEESEIVAELMKMYQKLTEDKKNG